MTRYFVLRTPSGQVRFSVNIEAQDDETVLVREDEMSDKVLCVQHRGGWCALKPGATLDSSATSDATACGCFVIMRIGSGTRVPTCEECSKALKLAPPLSPR